MTGRCGVAIACAAVVACGGAEVPAGAHRAAAGDNGTPAPDDAALLRDLEATVLEGYSQLTLGNIEAYADHVAEDVPIVFFGLGPRDRYIGPKAAAPLDVFRIDVCREVLSKNLFMHLSRDRSVAWVFDDVSCRAPDPFEGRTASIPLRLTAVYQRYLDTWTLVAQHVSYAVPPGEIVRWAANGQLQRPARIRTEIARSDGVRRQIASALGGLLRGSPRYVAQKLARDETSVVVGPGPLHEFYGADVAAAPPVARWFGDGANVRPDGMYVGLARSERVAWVAVNLAVTARAGDAPVAFGLRGLYVFERRDDTPGVWQQVQAHVSVPVTRELLARRVFGAEP
ncbi:MAG: hypothetical protein D6689_02810 [Deltaproteobacteria bacterium]|nr:MAG: hypothetical protein D6689_02810 [Deltaproteobacteria bacterium]